MNNIKKSIIITGVILIAAILIITLTLLFLNKGMMEIPVDGANIKVNNIYNIPGRKSFGDQIHFKDSNDYQIFYNEGDKSFGIVILSNDLNKGRSEAEMSFLSSLGISKEEACKLKVNLGVPYNIDPNYAIKNYGLSFCPDGKQF